MESPKYLIIITLIDGQNFTVPEGVPEKVEASVFVEARFGNESILKSDHIKLSNANPEFVTELAWQLDKKTLHQLRVERRAIKLQVFLQTNERKKIKRKASDETVIYNAQPDEPRAAHKVELIGYTVLDIRSAQERDDPKFQWLPLLNPKFRKSSYNRPEIQLALTLSRLNESSENGTQPKENQADVTPPSGESSNDGPINITEVFSESDANTSNESRLYKTCLDESHDTNQPDREEILENDINIRCTGDIFYIYDAKSKDKSTVDDCDERYRISVMIPFNSELEALVATVTEADLYYFSISLFQTSRRTELFKNLTCVETKEVQFNLITTGVDILTTYFEIYSTLMIKLHHSSGQTLGLATIHLDQLCRSDRKRRSIEGIFALQPMTESERSTVHPSIGVSVVLERLSEDPHRRRTSCDRSSATFSTGVKQHLGQDIDEFIFNDTFNDTHQLTLEKTKDLTPDASSNINGVVNEKCNATKDEDRHFCFTIDLKTFNYTPNQRLIPTLRELVVRYSYPFFGYKDTITTDSSMPMGPTKSIIISGFCEFNFATTTRSLLAALQEIPLNLEILTCGNPQTVDTRYLDEDRLVARCHINLAEVMDFNEESSDVLKDKGLNRELLAPIYAINGGETGQLEVCLNLKDLGPPNYDLKSSVEDLDKSKRLIAHGKTMVSPHISKNEPDNLLEFVNGAKSDLEIWKQDVMLKLEDDMRKRENERLKRITQRFETKDAKRDLEFKKKMDDLENLEKKLKVSCNQVVSIGEKLANTIEQLKNKYALLDTRVEAIDLKYSKVVGSLRQDLEKKMESSPVQQRPVNLAPIDFRSRIVAKVVPEQGQARRSSLKNTNVQGIPIPVRSTSLVRGASDGIATKVILPRPKSIVTTVTNGNTVRPRSNSTRLSKDSQEKLMSLRREKAELLKRGCRPTDELIQEINSLIEKLAY